MIDTKGDALKLKQLPLDLQIDDEAIQDASGGFVPPDEAHRISEAAMLAFEQLTRDSAAVGWVEEYQRLREVGWPWRVACYIAWASSPKKDRSPKTQAELATRFLGLTSDRQISTWRKRNPVIDETISMLQAAPLINHRRDIYDALIESATNPNYKGHQDRKLALELLGDYVQRRDVKLQGTLRSKGVTEKSDAELLAMLGEEAADDEDGE